jgi:hypothetical protein
MLCAYFSDQSTACEQVERASILHWAVTLALETPAVVGHSITGAVSACIISWGRGCKLAVMVCFCLAYTVFFCFFVVVFSLS